MNRPVKRINYSDAMRKVRKIRRLSSDLTGESRDLNNVINDIVYIWKGEASKQFISQGEILEDSIKSTATKMDQLADKIFNAAVDIRAEDDRRLERYHEWLDEHRSS
ncbi:hypothetical protein SH1V18_10990 [Vallitalea longa]|uniref:WXG100 family type VII secretion target n=1 Tax=Vallitalea longa TaxID=2936439 RepID=A0A9W5Y8S3_9FIRM|nr:WXG100 family type VII secretion target [Vallitalea longa]GKX28619.1 hypothetical protein SH1V18_10990 [Vallitalea longa]